MEFGILKQYLIEGVELVLKNDNYLLINDINELTICHRLALYMEPLFEDWNVDCEYNGNVDEDNGRKYIRLLWETANNQEPLEHLEEIEERQKYIQKLVYPDIIVHKRGRNGQENNLLIVEVKKSSNSRTRVWDHEKLRLFTSNQYENEFNYAYGVFLEFIVGQEPSYTAVWYQSGEKK